MKCLIDGCDRESVIRGLCQPCYQLARLKVIASKTTWKELEDMGLCGSKKNQGGSGGPFSKAFNERKENEMRNKGL